MRRLGWVFGLAPVFVSVLNADWKIVTRTGDWSTTEYFKGALMRTDSSRVYTEVLDFEHRSQVNWRNDLRQYVVIEWPPAEAQNQSMPGPSIVIERNTTDTGERQRFFGRTARRLVTRMTCSDDASETTIDGWYVEAPGLPKWKSGGSGTIAILTMTVAGQRQGPPRIEVKQTGPAPEGLLVRGKTVSSFTAPGGSPHTTEIASEVTELVEAPLPDRFFQPPDGYQRVLSLPSLPARAAPPTWGELLQAHWRMVEDWFSGVFRGHRD